MKKSLISLLIGVCSIGYVQAQTLEGLTNYEFTNYAEVQNCKFRMWVPPTTQKVKGVVVAFTQMQEVVSLDRNLREVCMAEDLAIVWASQLGENDYPKLEAGLKALAEASGMPEIADAPFATVAHSTAGIFCRTMALQKPEKCFAIVQLSAVDYRDNQQLKDIPWLSVKNGSEETDDNYHEARYFMVNDKEAYKRPDGSSSGDDKVWESPRGNGCRISLVSLPGGGHFGWSPFESKLVSTFIGKAAHYQLGEPGTPIKRVAEEDGWLYTSEFDSMTDVVREPAAYKDYNGDPKKAFWYIDEEMARLWKSMYEKEVLKQKQTMTLSTFDTGVWQTSTKRMDLSKGGIDAAYPVDAAASVEGNPVKVKLYHGIYKIEDGKDLFYSPARYGFVATKDWITFYQEGTDSHQYAEITSGQVEATNFPASTEISASAIADQDITAGKAGYNVTGDADHFIVSGPVSLTDEGWKFDNYISVPKAQVYVRHAGGNHNNLKETKFNITNTRTAQTVTFDESVPSQVESGKTKTIDLLAKSTGANATIVYKLISGPASLEGNKLTTTGEEGMVVVMAIASNDANNPGKAVMEINVNQEAAVNEIQVNAAKVYPTLTDGIVYVDNAREGAEVVVYDINGRVLNSDTVKDSHFAVSIENMAKGMYLISVDGKTTKVIRK